MTGRLYVEEGSGWRELGWTTDSIPPAFAQATMAAEELSAAFRQFRDASVTLSATLDTPALRRFIRMWQSLARRDGIGPRPLCINGTDYRRRQRARRRRHGR